MYYNIFRQCLFRACGPPRLLVCVWRVREAALELALAHGLSVAREVAFALVIRAVGKLERFLVLLERFFVLLERFLVLDPARFFKNELVTLVVLCCGIRDHHVAALWCRGVHLLLGIVHRATKAGSASREKP